MTAWLNVAQVGAIHAIGKPVGIVTCGGDLGDRIRVQIADESFEQSRLMRGDGRWEDEFCDLCDCTKTDTGCTDEVCNFVDYGDDDD